MISNLISSTMTQGIIFCCLATVLMVIPASATEGFAAAMPYLVKYNYLGIRNPDRQMQSLTSPAAIKRAIIDFQLMAHIPPTGVADNLTLEWMEKRRCGNDDTVNMISMTRRKKRYVVEGSRWGKTSLTYRIYTYTTDMTRTTTDREIKRAFQVWSDYTPLTFRQIRSGTPDISITFAVGEHGDGNAFDGPGGTLAHAFFPRFGGNTHFDDAERFTSESDRGVNLFQVAAHEFGHSLGLSHSRVQSSLMAPFYRGFVRNFKLDSDDINGIQYLYGPPRNVPRPTPAPTPQPGETTTTELTPSGERDYCVDGQFDDIVMLGSKVTYGFRGRYYYKIASSGIEPGYPKLISQGWKELPNNIDAAVSFPVYSGSGRFRTIINDDIWFFKDSMIYKYNRFGRPTSQPSRISSAIRGLPNNVDAAFVWSGNSLTYITKGNQYYRLNPQRNAVDPGYPRPMSVWTTYSTEAHKEQLSFGISAAFEYSNARTYFFIGPNYYRFNDQTFKVDNTYPRLVSVWWYGCRSNDIRQDAKDEKDDAGDTFETIGGKDGQNADNKSSTTFTITSLALVLAMSLLVTVL